MPKQAAVRLGIDALSVRLDKAKIEKSFTSVTKWLNRWRWLPKSHNNRTTRRVLEVSDSRKLGHVSITRTSQITCPLTCPLLGGGGCYSETGPTNVHTERISRHGPDTIIAAAHLEAADIRGLSGKRPLRIHDVRDCPSDESARIVSAAADEYMAKHNQPVWTYTHADDVPRDAWGKVSVLRSVHSMDEARKALTDGYAPALLVRRFKKATAYKLADDLIGIPCPYDTGRAKNCLACGLCWRDKFLHSKRKVILFEPHGARAEEIRCRIK